MTIVAMVENIRSVGVSAKIISRFMKEPLDLHEDQTHVNLLSMRVQSNVCAKLYNESLLTD